MKEFENQPISTASHCFLIYLPALVRRLRWDFGYIATRYQREKAWQLFLGRRY
jgi:hypothetical protein